MADLNDFITENCEVATLTTQTFEHVRTLACRHCGVLVWDVPKHMLKAHDLLFRPDESAD